MAARPATFHVERPRQRAAVVTLELTARQREQLTAFAAAVRASPHNLLSRRALDELESRHIAESLGVAATLPAQPHSVLDLGTGGGFPGLVVAIARPDLRVTLLDGTRKKIEFVAHVARELAIPVQVAHGRAEQLVHSRPDLRVDVVTARAVAPLARLVPWAIPFLRPNGQLWALKGKQWEEELEEAAPVLRRSGASVLAVPDTVRPQDDPQDVGGGFVVVRPRIVIIGRTSSRA